MCVFVCAAWDKEATAVECNALIAQLLHYMHYHDALITHRHTHTRWGQLQPSGMLSDPFCVTAEVIAARDAGFDELFSTEAGKSPVVTQPRCPLSTQPGAPDWPPRTHDRPGLLYTAQI